MFKKIFLVIAVGGATLAGWRSYDAATPQQVKELRNPAPPGSLAPSLSATSDGKVMLSWLEPVDSVLTFRFATWNGSNWTRPNTVLRRADLQPDSAAPPVIASLRDGSMVAVWPAVVKGTGKEDGNFLYSAASRDGGVHWSTPIRIHSDKGISEHSYHSVVATGTDDATIVWLDSRDYEAKHRYRLMSATIDSMGKVSNERTVDEDTCTCCPTAFVKTRSGAVAAYRGHTPEEIRDIKVAQLANGNWQNPHTVHDDGWKINGCPVNGPAIANNGNHLATIWFTGSHDKPEVKAALSDDLGTTFRAPIILETPEGENRPVGHVAISLLDDGSAVAIWLHHQPSGTEIVGERISSSGEPGGRFTIASGTEAGLGYPRAQRVGNQILVSWSGKTGKEVRTAIIAQP